MPAFARYCVEDGNAQMSVDLNRPMRSSRSESRCSRRAHLMRIPLHEIRSVYAECCAPENGLLPITGSRGSETALLLSFTGMALLIDPCVGQGTALHLVTSNAQVRRYGDELDAERTRVCIERCRRSNLAPFSANFCKVSMPARPWSCQSFWRGTPEAGLSPIALAEVGGAGSGRSDVGTGFSNRARCACI
jgi:hypothetical protein